MKAKKLTLLWKDQTVDLYNCDPDDFSIEILLDEVSFNLDEYDQYIAPIAYENKKQLLTNLEHFVDAKVVEIGLTKKLPTPEGLLTIFSAANVIIQRHDNQVGSITTSTKD